MFKWINLHICFCLAAWLIIFSFQTWFQNKRSRTRRRLRKTIPESPKATIPSSSSSSTSCSDVPLNLTTQPRRAKRKASSKNPEAPKRQITDVRSAFSIDSLISARKSSNVLPKSTDAQVSRLHPVISPSPQPGLLAFPASASSLGAPGWIPSMPISPWLYPGCFFTTQEQCLVPLFPPGIPACPPYSLPPGDFPAHCCIFPSLGLVSGQQMTTEGDSRLHSNDVISPGSVASDSPEQLLTSCQGPLSIDV